MKIKPFYLLLTAFAVFILAFGAISPASAAPVSPSPLSPVSLIEEAPPFDPTAALGAAWQFILGSAAIAGAVTFLVNIAKQLGLKDNHALTAVSVGNTILIFTVFTIKLLSPTFDLSIFESVAATIVQQGPGLILPLLPILVWLSRWFHERVKGAAWIGFSYSIMKSAK